MAKPVARPPSQERQPVQQDIEPLVYEPIRPRSAASSHHREGTSTSRRLHQAKAVPLPVEVPQVSRKPSPVSVPAPVPVSLAVPIPEPPVVVRSAPVRRERQFPFASAGFVPKSKRERDAEAAQVPLPPSPTIARQVGLELPSPLSLDAAVEPPATETSPVPSADVFEEAVVEPAPMPVAPVPSASSSSSGERRKAPVLVNRIQPSFRPRRAGGETSTPTAAPSQPRKVSAFGAPSIVTTTVKPPPVPVVVPANPKTSKPAALALVSQGRPTASSTSSRSVSGQTPPYTAPTPSPLPTSTSAPNVPAAPKATSGSKNRVVSTPASSTSIKPSNQGRTNAAPSAAPAPSMREPRIRNATGMTMSQMMKQKPPVHKNGFMPTSKLRSGKSTTTIASAARSGASATPPVPKLPAGAKKDAKVPVPAEVAAVVPLPPSPKLAPASLLPVDVPLPPSPEVSRAIAARPAEKPRAPPAEPAFPTIESIKERLSDVLAFSDVHPETGDLPTAEPVVARSASVPDAVLPTHSTPEEEPEFTLSDLETPLPQATLSAAVADPVVEETDTFEMADFEAIEEVPVVSVTSKTPASSPGKVVDGEKVYRGDLEGRIVLGDVGTNLAI